MAIDSRKKGAAYERKLCRKFSNWSTYKIVRTPASGGILKTGDLCPKEPLHMVLFPFSVEAKNRQRWDMSDLIKNVKLTTGIKSWWQQCIDDATESKKVPILVFTQNLDEDFLMLYEEDACKMGLTKFRHFKFYGKNYEPLYIGLLSDLLSLDYKKIEKLYGKKYRQLS